MKQTIFDSANALSHVSGSTMIYAPVHQCLFGVLIDNVESVPTGNS